MLKKFVHIFSYWLILFQLVRFVHFLSIVLSPIKVSLKEASEAFYEGLRLDFSSACYLTPLPLIFCAIAIFSDKKWPLIFAKYVLIFETIIYALIGAGEIVLYQEWQTKLSMQAVLHFIHPDEVFKTADGFQTFSFFGLLALFVLISIPFLKKICANAQRQFPILAESLIALGCLGICGIFFRGGLQPIPIQESDACYSNNITCNDIAINPFFSFSHSAILHFSGININKFAYTTDSIAFQGCQPLLNNKPYPKVNLSKIERPNYLFIIWESASSNCSKFFGGDDYLPHLDEMARKGFACTNCIATGYVSDQGIPAVFSGQPSTPSITLIHDPIKSKYLPSCIPYFKSIGYESAFYFGGQLSYGNIKNYILQNGFEEVQDQRNIKGKFFEQRLGYSDGDMSKYYLDKIAKAKQPFIYSWFTLSSHNPYDIPVPKKDLGVPESDYINSLQYTDAVLRDFMATAEQQPWYNNTIIIIVADHSHITHWPTQLNQLDRFRIPLILTGGALLDSLRGKQQQKLVSQVDIMATILRAANAPIDTINRFTYSRTLFSDTNLICSCSYHAGGGLAIDTSAIMYDLNAKNLVYCAPTEAKKELTRNWLHYIYSEYVGGK